MNGSAGPFLSRNPRPERNMSNGYAPSLKKGCADLVAGQAVFIVEIVGHLRKPTVTLRQRLAREAVYFRLVGF